MTEMTLCSCRTGALFSSGGSSSLKGAGAVLNLDLNPAVLTKF